MFTGVSLKEITPVFARHETFHPRFGWLKKGFDTASQDSTIFLNDNAPVILGVGKNMVRSIRYWCQAFKILEEDRPTSFGQKLLSEKGWDSFLENPASLWLLHWYFIQSPCYATAWYYTFNIFRQIEFNFDDLFLGLKKYSDESGFKLAESSLKKDVACLLRMYAKPDTKGKLIEDSIDCPFAELGIIHPISNSQYYTFRIGDKVSLPAEIIVAACLQYAQDRSSAKTISVSSLTYDKGSPGLIFKLPETVISNAIESVSRSLNGIALSDTAGLIQLSFDREAELLVQEILDNYYRTK